MSSTAALDAEQTARIVALESASQAHATRIRTIEDAVLSLSANFDLIAKTARILLGIVGIGLGLNIGEISGVIE